MVQDAQRREQEDDLETPRSVDYTPAAGEP
jgi:hypothetical protein